MDIRKLNSWHFLLIVILAYLVLFVSAPNIFSSSWYFFEKTFLKILPVFGVVLVLMTLVNRYIDKDFILKHLRDSKLKSWLFFIIGGIASTGPMYMWYPLLKKIKDNGVTNGEIACFLYNRSIKPALLPLMILYFSLSYVIVLTLLMIALSIIQALIIERILPATLPSQAKS